MLIKNEKPIKIIGYPESSMTQEGYEFLHCDGALNLEIILPEEFIRLNNKEDFQYQVVFSVDMPLREEICDIIDSKHLDCVTFIHDSCVVSPNARIGKGVFIGPFSSVLQQSEIKDFCCIEAYCLVSHYVIMQKNCIMHSGVLIGGRTTIGERCVFGFKSSVSNKVSVADDVEVCGFSNLTKDAIVSGKYIGSVARLVKT
jgi:bifunctional N-acetylglucosamine-1-phosphate-uridyltransferase/glucosamine-1-phosphate-acetyltransferase GlmU-like protein